MDKFLEYGLSKAKILLPGTNFPPEKWSVVACDQYTSQPEWWARAEALVGDQPSTLRLIHPECYLDARAPEVSALHGVMRDYLRDVLTRVVTGFVLVERETTTGTRLGLVAALDLAAYDYEPGTRPLVRSTEGTVKSRLPARMEIRRGAPLELPHVMLLCDDPSKTLIEPVYEKRATLPLLYDFELMQKGGHIRGYAIEREAEFAMMEEALSGLKSAANGFLFAVGDGNHSLAAARACWLERGCPDDETRFALVEICNLHDPALVFEPIHRALFHADEAKLSHDFIMYCRARGMSVVPCDEAHAQLYLLDAPVRIENAENPLAVAILQPFLDDWVTAHPGVTMDYIHGLEALASLPCCRLRLTAMHKRDLFPAVRKAGALPRKTFSMGEAPDKRYYLECRALAPE